MSRREAGEAAEVRGKYLLRVLLNGHDHGLCLGLGLGHVLVKWSCLGGNDLPIVFLHFCAHVTKTKTMILNYGLGFGFGHGLGQDKYLPTILLVAF